MTTYGGNSGYIGFSESRRAYEAKIDGKFPKTLFKKEYGISEKQFKMLEDRGVIYISEWHHTSKYGNKTNFYKIENHLLFYLLIGDKQKAFNLYKTRQYYTFKAINKKSIENKNIFLNCATEYFIGKVSIGEVVNYRNTTLKCIHKTKHRKAPIFIFVK